MNLCITDNIKQGKLEIGKMEDDLYIINGDMRGTHCYMINHKFIENNIDKMLPFTYQFDIELTKTIRCKDYSFDYYNNLENITIIIDIIIMIIMIIKIVVIIKTSIKRYSNVWSRF